MLAKLEPCGLRLGTVKSLIEVDLKMINNYIFKKQVGNRGVYLELVFEANVLNRSGNNINIEYLADAKWEIMCKAGILIFHDFFARKIKGDLDVRVYEIKWLPVDTNNLLVMYACVNALSEALNVPIKGLAFDVDNETFHFPELRSR